MGKEGFCWSPHRSWFLSREQDGGEQREGRHIQMADTQHKRLVRGLGKCRGPVPRTQRMLNPWCLVLFLIVFPVLVGLVLMCPAQPLWPHHKRKFSNPCSSMRSDSLKSQFLPAIFGLYFFFFFLGKLLKKKKGVLEIIFSKHNLCDLFYWKFLTEERGSFV